MTVAGTALAAYLLGVLRLAGHGRRWPRRRAVGFATGAILLGVAASPRLDRLAATDFRYHVAGHLLLGGFAPIALALARPVTLILATMPARARRRAIRVLRSRAARTVAHPVTAATLVIAPLYPLYLTPLYGVVERHALLHTAVHLHVVLAGYLFAAVTIGVDAGHPAALRTRLTALVGAIAGHAILAKLLYISAFLPGYPGGQVRAGAQLMYYGGDAAELLLVAAVFAGWYRRAGRVRPAQVSGFPPVTPSTSPVT